MKVWRSPERFCKYLFRLVSLARIISVDASEQGKPGSNHDHRTHLKVSLPTMLNSLFRKFAAILLCCGVLGLMGCVSGSADAPSKPVAASITLTLTDPVTGAALTSVSMGKPAKVSATVRDTTGAVVPNTVVTFTTTETLVRMLPSSGTALTDASGVATIQVDAASFAAAGATTVSAAATLGTTPVTGSVGISVTSVNSGATGINVALTNPSTGLAVTSISTGNPAKVTATVRDSSGAVVPNAVVTFSTSATLATMIPASGTALTDSFGVATIQIAAASSAAGGATTVSASAEVGGITISANAGFSVIATSTGATGVVSAALTNPATGLAVSSISAGSPGRVTATVRDGSGAPVPNVVVTFSTAATLATMVPASGTALTDAFGVASVQIVGASPIAAGATTVTAIATLGTSTVSGSVAFSVIPSSSGATGISIALTSPSSGMPVSTISMNSAAKVTATVRDGSGALLPNTVVTFNTSAALATMIPASGTALTDASGVASIQIIGASPTAAGATTISATALVSGASVSTSAGFGVLATNTGATGISIALTSPSTGQAVTNVSTGNPAKVTATLRDTAGAVVPNTVVTFTTNATLASMIPSSGTALTDASGVATIQINAASPTAAGAATITAAASVGGASLSASAGFGVTPSSSGVTGTIKVTGLELVNSIRTGDLVTVDAIVNDASGKAVPNTVVTFVTPAALITMFPSSGSVVTDVLGRGSIQIAAASPSAAGAATIAATAIVNGNPVSGSVNINVLATTSAASVAVALTNPATGVAVTNISSGKPARVTATVKNGNGVAVPNTVVTFVTSASMANMTPTSGTALTDSSGIASIQIDPSSPLAAGAATITATATVDGASVVGSASYSVTPSNVGVPGVSVALLDPGTGNAVSSISPGSPAKVKATIRNAAGAGVANTVVTFSTSATLATMTPTTGTALTDASGVATIQIDAASLTAAGATTITATASVEGATVSGSVGFSVSAVNAGLANMTVGTSPLSSYATTSVSVAVTGVPASIPVTINFSSICAGTGKAMLPASVQSVNGVATATYTDKGCASTDTITASVAGLAVTKTVTLTVNSPGAASLQFVSATPQTIVLKGTGGAGLLESSLVKFRAVDSNNVPVSSGINVTFDLTTRTGGILLDGVSTAVTKLTDSNGEATIAVQSGTAPTAVWVNASLSGTSVFSQSNQLRISTGRPAQDRFSLGVTTHNIEGYTANGVTTAVGVIASDRLGNPVPDGTAINFIAEGGQISPSCATVSGTCSVTFTSANPRPTGDSEPNGIVTKGRATVLAYTLGEESFVDANGNNKYDAGETFTDLGDVFIDNKETGVWDATEQSIAYASNSQACSNTISTSPSAPSKARTCDGVWGQAHVRQSDVVVFSGSDGYVKASRPTGTDVPGSIAVPAYSMGGATKCFNSPTFTFYAFDQNKNPLPAGTILTVSFPTSSLNAATISPATVQDSNAAGGTAHSLQITKNFDSSGTACGSLGTSGVTLTVTMTTPNKTVSIVSMTVND